MSYATPANVREALAPADDYDSEATAAALSDVDLSRAISDAEVEINARVSGAPFDPVPALVKQITVAFAAFHATLRHNRNDLLPSEHPVRLRFSWAQSMLDKLARGEIDLEPPNDGVSGEATVVNTIPELFTLRDAGLSASRECYRGPRW